MRAAFSAAGMDEFWIIPTSLGGALAGTGGSLVFAEFPAVRADAACDEVAVEAGVWWLQPVAVSASVAANAAKVRASVCFIVVTL